MTDYDKLFINALENRDIQTLKLVPKADLHNHFFLGGKREYIEQRLGINIPRLSQKLYSMDDMHKWVGQNIGDIFDTADKRTLAIEAAFVQADNDGVVVLEIGDDVWANGHFYNGDIDLLIQTFQSIHEKYAPKLEFKFQIGLSRHCPVNLLEEWITPFLEKDCFYSIDLYGDEMTQSIKNFKPIYRKAKDKGLVLKAHVGEWGDADSIKEAVDELELNEVQHGISASKSPSVMNWLVDNKIQLNICPTSNVMLNRVESLKVHPIRILFDYGVKVTVNSDDILVFDQSVSQEFLNLYEAGLFSTEELNLIRKYGLGE
ncbi:MAG: adenosine deaminase [Bacillota bacterium]